MLCVFEHFLSLPIDRIIKRLFCTESLSIVPSWSDLSKATLPSTDLSKAILPSIDCLVEAKKNTNANIDDIIESQIDQTLPIFYRERNGWCVHSARLWLAMEAKGIRYNTCLVEARGDTYDGSPKQDEEDNTDGRPECLLGLDLPQLRAVSTDGKHELLSGAGNRECMSLLEKLDDMFPSSKPIWPPLDHKGNPACKREVVSAAIRAFMGIAPGSEICRQSPRAAWLFCSEEGYRLDPLPRETFEKVLDGIEAVLGQSSGVFLAGNFFSAADFFWSPMLERYSAQLPCLYEGLRPRGDVDRWPHMNAWYKAMDNVPAYACRVRGDGLSWRKVLYREPWWPSEETWHPRDTVGPKGELKASEDEVINLFGDTNVQDDVWEKHVSSNLHVAMTPEREAAACIIRNHQQLSSDFIKWADEWGYDEFSADEIDRELRKIATDLAAYEELTVDIGEKITNRISLALAAYFDDRICVPRDMGAPAATKLRTSFVR